MKKLIWATILFVILMAIFDYIEDQEISSKDFLILLIEGCLFGLICHLFLLFKNKKKKEGF